MVGVLASKAMTKIASTAPINFLLAVLLVLTLSACRPPDNADVVRGSDTNQANNTEAPDNGVRVSTEVVGEPALGSSAVRVYVLHNNAAADGATVQITGDMTHAGMEPVISDAVQLEAGLYETQDFSFTMSGDWFITADVTLASGETSSDVISLTVPGN
jgi:hypothetical protein